VILRFQYASIRELENRSRSSVDGKSGSDGWLASTGFAMD
jgi:hypothetical protein